MTKAILRATERVGLMVIEELRSLMRHENRKYSNYLTLLENYIFMGGISS
ncbi:MAG: hypothetical protein V7K48_28795 [Nostoc sp.]